MANSDKKGMDFFKSNTILIQNSAKINHLCSEA